MSRYRANVVERVQAAQSAQAKVTGVHQVQENKSGNPSVEDWVANGGVIERLPSYGNMFIDTARVPYADV